MATYTGSDKRLQYLFTHGGGGGGGADIWVGTLAEYTQQASQIADGTTVLITDDEGSYIEVGHVYSETEHAIGVWIDGKIIYEKTISGTTITGNTTYSVNHNIANIYEIINHSVNCHFSSNGLWRKLNFVYNNGYMNDAWFGGYAIGSTTIDFQCGSSFAGGVDKWYATIQYTKTS